MDLEPYTIGQHTEDTCHKTSHSRRKELLKHSQLSATDLTTASGTLTICTHHKKLFLYKYEFPQKNCCDPFSVHTKSVKSSLSTLDIAKAERINSLTTGTNVKNKFRKFALNVWPGCH
jgi:hypothetical protein